MTSTTDTDEHPEVAEISALTDGLLSPSRTSDLREHLTGCALCADVQASLEEIRELLGTLPGPTRMPADVVSRIDAALAAEALLDATAPADGVSRETAREAVSVTAVAEAGLVSRETAPSPTAPTADRPAGHARSTTGPGRRPAGRPLARGRRWPKALLGTAAAAAVLGIGTLLVQVGSGDDAKTGAGADSGKKKTESSVLSAENLTSQVRTMLAGEAGSKTPESGDVGAQSSPTSPLRGDAATVPSCVQNGIGRSETPIAAKQDTFEGTDAYIVVLPHPGDNTRVDAYVVDASCTEKSPAPAGKVLLNRSYPRR
ncbi:anti-sigma factor family protein [Streptomyces sp. H27-D2]|uniref:anti-sigma factor family protein n=1 Tax=Streptomyces sp. H27-D2 TaxID=3046304 RepID=UPI002DB70270|nr:zf-HC2 domain-containing protein [Streptomyces sp. H27-D2]MEC4015747.1 zf-HC2 domain-containing protein [Streptomyces sp. H27-D2]